MTKRCSNYRQFHTGTYGTPHMSFHYGQTSHVKRFCPLLNGFGSVGQFSSQLWAPVQSFGLSTLRPTVAPRSEAKSSFEA